MAFACSRFFFGRIRPWCFFATNTFHCHSLSVSVFHFVVCLTFTLQLILFLPLLVNRYLVASLRFGSKFQWRRWNRMHKHTSLVISQDSGDSCLQARFQNRKTDLTLLIVLIKYGAKKKNLFLIRVSLIKSRWIHTQSIHNYTLCDVLRALASCSGSRSAPDVPLF